MNVRLLCSLCVVKAAASAMGWSLVQRKPIGCLIMCDIETSIMRLPRPQWGCCTTEKQECVYKIPPPTDILNCIYIYIYLTVQAIDTNVKLSSRVFVIEWPDDHPEAGSKHAVIHQSAYHRTYLVYGIDNVVKYNKELKYSSSMSIRYSKPFVQQRTGQLDSSWCCITVLKDIDRKQNHK